MHIYWVHCLCMNETWASIQTENSSALKNALAWWGRDVSGAGKTMEYDQGSPI